jgi:predicted CopG family antitoxin
MVSKTIRISPENYKSLKKLGGTGDSFNYVVTEILKKINSLQESNGVSHL